MAGVTVVLEQHAEEAAFLWVLRDAAVAQPHYSLADLAKLDGRVDAHIDGLRIAGDDGWEICKEALSWEEAGEVFAAGVLALESGDRQRIDEVVEAGTASPEIMRGLVSALGWIGYEVVQTSIKDFLADESPALRCVGIAASAVHRRDPGVALQDAISADDLLLRARALEAVGELGRVDLLKSLPRHFQSEDPGCRFAAAWSAARLGEKAAAPVLQRIAEGEGPEAMEALQLAFRLLGPNEAAAWCRELPGQPGGTQKLIVGCGALGDPNYVRWLIKQMHDPETARVAGEALSMITGVDIAYEDLEGEQLAGFEAGPTENPEDEDVALDPDENLPWPDPELIRAWWLQREAEFQPGTRYLAGKPITDEWLQHVLRLGWQRQRAAAALELAIRHPSEPLFEVRAPGFRQQKLLGTRGRIR